MARLPLPSGYPVAKGNIIEAFENLPDWSISGGTASINTSVTTSGAGSLRLQTGIGTNCIATKTINQDLSRSPVILLKVYVENHVNLDTLLIYLSNDSGFTNYFSKQFTPGPLHEGWNYLLIPRSQWSSAGSPSWANAMVRMRVRVNALPSLIVTGYFDEVRAGSFSRPKCVLSFDDSHISNYTVAYPYMQPRGLKGTLFTIADWVDNGTALSVAQLREMYNAGWDVASHTKTHTSLPSYPDVASQLAEFQGFETWAVSKGFTRRGGYRHIAFPQGNYDDNTISALTQYQALSGRPLRYRIQANALDNSQILGCQLIGDPTTIAQAKAFVDLAIESGGLIYFVFHKLISTALSSNLDWAITDFQALIDYLVLRNHDIDVVTLTEWYAGLANPRRSIS